MNSTGAMPKKSTCPIFSQSTGVGQTADDSELFTNIWLSSIGSDVGARRRFLWRKARVLLAFLAVWMMCFDHAQCLWRVTPRYFAVSNPFLIDENLIDECRLDECTRRAPVRRGSIRRRSA